LLRPGEPEPAPLAELPHEGAALGRVDDLRHVLPREIEDLGVVVLVEKALDLLGEGPLLGRELEIHARSWLIPEPDGPKLMGRQMRARSYECGLTDGISPYDDRQCPIPIPSRMTTSLPRTGGRA